MDFGTNHPGAQGEFVQILVGRKFRSRLLAFSKFSPLLTTGICKVLSWILRSEVSSCSIEETLSVADEGRKVAVSATVIILTCQRDWCPYGGTTALHCATKSTWEEGSSREQSRPTFFSVKHLLPSPVSEVSKKQLRLSSHHSATAHSSLYRYLLGFDPNLSKIDNHPCVFFERRRAFDDKCTIELSLKRFPTFVKLLGTTSFTFTAEISCREHPMQRKIA